MRVALRMELPTPTLLALADMAHERRLTLGQLVEHLIRKATKPALIPKEGDDNEVALKEEATCPSTEKPVATC